MNGSEFIPVVCIYSEGGMSPVPQSDNNGGTTINEILHETAKYELKLLYKSFIDSCLVFVFFSYINSVVFS